MNYLVEKMPLLSQAELAQLFGPAPKAPATGVDAGFRYRNAFMMLVVLVHVVRLLFFPDQIYTPFDLSASAMDQLPQYFQYRGLYVLLVAAVYCYSYTKDWYFDRVALVVFAMASSSLSADFFNIYAFTRPRKFLNFFWDIGGALWQISDVADGCLDDIIVAEVATNFPCFRWRFDNHQFLE